MYMKKEELAKRTIEVQQQLNKLFEEEKKLIRTIGKLEQELKVLHEIEKLQEMV